MGVCIFFCAQVFRADKGTREQNDGNPGIDCSNSTGSKFRVASHCAKHPGREWRCPNQCHYASTGNYDWGQHFRCGNRLLHVRHRAAAAGKVE